MSGLRLPRLPDRTPVKLAIAVSPELKKDLDAYAACYAATYGADEAVADLIPAMLVQFLASDRGFAKARATSASG